jgi:uncharacterized membrane protein YvbJ
MKCPRCETENNGRSVCSKCGMFLYDGRTRNRVKMNSKEIARSDVKRVLKYLFSGLKIVWYFVVMIVLSILMIACIQYFAG